MKPIINSSMALMNEPKKMTLEDAITFYLSTLDSRQTQELIALIPNPKTEAGHRWIANVVAMFELNNPESALRKEISERFDESIFVGDIFENANGIMEAEILLREAKHCLKDRLRDDGD